MAVAIRRPGCRARTSGSTILHATDFSPALRAAFKKAVELAKQNRAELVLLHGASPAGWSQPRRAPCLRSEGNSPLNDPRLSVRSSCGEGPCH